MILYSVGKSLLIVFASRYLKYISILVSDEDNALGFKLDSNM